MTPTDSIRTGDVASAPAQRPGLGWWQATALATVGAVVVNEIVLFTGRAAGASFVLDDRGVPHVVTAVDVVAATWPMVVGVLLAALLGRWRAGFLRAGQIVGGGLALASVAGPMLAVTDSGTRLALALMHVIVGWRPCSRWKPSGGAPRREDRAPERRVLRRGTTSRAVPHLAPRNAPRAR